LTRPQGRTFGRIDNDLSYIVGNVEWQTHEVQQNNRRNNVFIEVDGRSARTPSLEGEHALFGPFDLCMRSWSEFEAIADGRVCWLAGGGGSELSPVFESRMTVAAQFDKSLKNGDLT
jgi:hypothetical protein